jgi:hypothetical protein
MTVSALEASALNNAEKSATVFKQRVLSIFCNVVMGIIPDEDGARITFPTLTVKISPPRILLENAAAQTLKDKAAVVTIDMMCG